MQLSDVIKVVKDNKLSKEQLEQYFDMVSALSAELLMEISELEKQEALYMDSKSKDESVASKKVSWKGSTGGQRLIVLKRYVEASKILLRSIKNKIYAKL
jgi:hypothetical protein